MTILSFEADIGPTRVTVATPSPMTATSKTSDGVTLGTSTEGSFLVIADFMSSALKTNVQVPNPHWCAHPIPEITYTHN